MEINDAGQITGTYTTTGGQSHAFLYTPGSGLRDLGTLGGTTSAPTGLNNAGQVVGSSTTAGGATHAFLWTPTDGMEDITAVTGITERAPAQRQPADRERLRRAECDRWTSRRRASRAWCNCNVDASTK